MIIKKAEKKKYWNGNEWASKAEAAHYEDIGVVPLHIDNLMLDFVLQKDSKIVPGYTDIQTFATKAFILEEI